MKKSPVFKPMHSKSAVGYSGFPQDHLANFTSVCGYLLPVYWDFLDPGDKVNIKTLLRTKTQPFSAPAMATVIERIEWFAVPIDQLYKPFSAKYYGINDIQSDLLPTTTYDDYLPYITLSQISQVIAGLPTTFEAQSSIPAGYTFPIFSEAKRLTDCLGFPYIIGSSTTMVTPGSVSALPFAAYQKIYSDWYRLTDREENDPQTYNLDSFFGATGTSANITNADRIRKLLILRKRPYMRDYFTSMQVSPLMGSQDINASGNDLGYINQWLSGLSLVKPAIADSESSAPGATKAVNSYGTTVNLNPAAGATATFVKSIASTLNPANIRSMFAVEKLLEVTRRAKKHYDAQTLAHFGVDVPSGLDGECIKIGTHEQYLQIGEVISQADTENGSLGQRAGLGNSEAQSETFKFEAKCHCILMGIYSAEPVVNLKNDGVDRRLLMTNASDFYRSEFDNLGLQPVFRRELYQSLYNTDNVANSNENMVVGWQPRYQQLKSRFNRSFGGCASPYFYEWSLNRESLSATGGLSRNFFFVWPTDLNNILLQQYTGNTNFLTMYSEDYFINQVYFDITKASKKSVYGVPNL